MTFSLHDADVLLFTIVLCLSAYAGGAKRQSSSLKDAPGRLLSHRERAYRWLLLHVIAPVEIALPMLILILDHQMLNRVYIMSLMGMALAGRLFRNFSSIDCHCFGMQSPGAENRMAYVLIGLCFCTLLLSITLGEPSSAPSSLIQMLQIALVLGSFAWSSARRIADPQTGARTRRKEALLEESAAPTVHPANGLAWPGETESILVVFVSANCKYCAALLRSLSFLNPRRIGWTAPIAIVSDDLNYMRHYNVCPSMCFDAATVDVGFKNKGFPHAVVLKRHDNSVMRSVLYATEDIHAAAFRLLSESAEEQAPRSEATAT